MDQTKKTKPDTSKHVKGFFIFMICVYKITNVINGKIYIGSTVDFDKRKSEHEYGILSGTHHNKNIRFDSLLHPASSFEIEPLSTFSGIKTVWLRYIEALWIDYLKYHYDLYNINLNTTGWGIQVKDFGCRKERLEYRKIAKLEKIKANDYVKTKLSQGSAIINDNSDAPF